MIFEKHNFHMNFSNASGMDSEAVGDVVAGEITELIIAEQEAVISVLKQAGVKVPEKVSRKRLLKLLIENVPHNVKLKDTLAKMIVENNLPGVSEQNAGSRSRNFSGDLELNAAGCPQGTTMNYFGFCIKNKSSNSSAFSGEYDSFYEAGGGAGAAAGDAAGKIIGGAAGGPVGAVAGALDSMFGFLKSGADKKVAQEQTRQALINNLTAKENARNLPPDGSGLSTGAIIGISLAGVAVLGVVVVLIVKMRKK